MVRRARSRRRAGGSVATVAISAAIGVTVGLLPWGALPAQAVGPAGATASAPAAGTGEPAVAATEEEALAQAARLGRNVEVLSLRGESSDVYATPEGTLEAREYLRPVRTRVDGEWKAVDTGLAPVAEGPDQGMVAPVAASVGLAFSGGGDGPLVRLERAGRTLELSWPGDVPQPRLDGDTATYPDILPDVDLRLAARPEGFTQLLVVKSAEAAANEELDELRLRLGAEGLTVRETANGGLEAVDEGAGGAVFEAPRPVMWDSSTGEDTASSSPEPASAVRPAALAAADDGPGAAADTEPGASDSGRQAPVGVDVPSGGDELVLTPDRELLTGDDTVYPVYIDPQWYTPRATSWTMASRYWASSPQWKFNDASDAGLGYCAWDYCKPHDLKRLFYQFPTTKFAGRSILSAEFVVRETHAASCHAREVQIWRTKGINSSTTWNTQNAAGFWIDHLQSRSFAHGYDGCASADAEFDVKTAVAQAAAHKWSTLTFGLRATTEDDRYTWKRFSDAAYLRVEYNRPPPRISTSKLTMDPGGACVNSSAPVRVRSRATVRASDVTDPDKDRVQVQFRALWDSGDGWKQRWISGRSTEKASGSDFSVQLPTSVPQNKTVGWQARAWDGGQWSPWSSENAHSCHFVYDTAVPAGPSIDSEQYPRSDAADPADPWWDGVGRYGTFTVDSSSTDVTKYWLGLNGPPTSGRTLTTSGGAAKSTKIMPTRTGVNFITAKAFDAAGNASETRTYYFRVRSGQPDRLSWQLDEGGGASEAMGEGGTWQASLYGGLAPGGEGAEGNGLTLDGTDDYAASDSPVLNTSKSFSVSLWAKLPDAPTGAPVAVAQAGSDTSGYEIYYSTALGGWTFLRHTTDASGTQTVRATQPACPSGDTACQAARVGTWTHLVGVFDNVNRVMKLHVDGELVATAAFSTPWDARGRTLLGAASHYGTVGNFFKGSLDEARFFDYQLTDGQVSRLHGRQPVDTGRPAKLVLPLDEAADAVALTGRAQQVATRLKNGTTSGVTGVNGRALEFDGTDDYATTGRPIMDTYQSFTVSAWVKLPKDKEARAMTAVAQSSTVNPGFELYHSSALGGWVFMRPESDTAGARVVRATQTACPENWHCTAARLGEWNHVVGVYDIDTAQLRLYVNGALEATAAFDTPWLATGEVTLGGAYYGGRPVSPLKGAIDDVRLYDRAVSTDEVRQLFKRHPVVKSRWKFETASTATPPVTPDAGPAGAGLGLYNGAAVGSGWVDGGLTLDGVDDYAATASGTVPVDTSASFTVSAFAQTAATPTGEVALLSAPGTNKDAFSVRYVPSATPETDGGRWRITTSDADTGTAGSTQVENGRFFGPEEWTHLALVYDGFARELRLYVNGELEEVACTDADDDGVPDVSGCTERVSYADNVVTFKAVQSLRLGRDRAGAYFPGSVSDVWTFQGTLDDLQIERLAVGMPGTGTTVPGSD
ncbi:LamG-like jellyroll fold domain-containing protein [Streptomyces sp. AC558_RSS880]|uniref:LamG-like jellyroll fold domain-containing protein n=1 Tax=Streptomyces sp. AC558_RSS880 TaxID=2823687 RepID=UPI001C2122A2|nr:LamG-like jellyroll fold domain-containing protein [Streptomyces sp. AC558_RSS880]